MSNTEKCKVHGHGLTGENPSSEICSSILEDDPRYRRLDENVQFADVHIASIRNNVIELSGCPSENMSSSANSQSSTALSSEWSVSTAADNEQSHANMSERVASLATAIYQEFEHLVQMFPSHNFKVLMALVIRSLNSLDMAYQEQDDRESENELLKDDREQLLAQWERERELRKNSDEKYIRLEDAIEEQKCSYEEQLRLMKRALKGLDMKLKNALDHAVRLETSEMEARNKYVELHDRYGNLMRSQCSDSPHRRKPSSQEGDWFTNSVLDNCTTSSPVLRSQHLKSNVSKEWSMFTELSGNGSKGSGVLGLPRGRSSSFPTICMKSRYYHSPTLTVNASPASFDHRLGKNVVNRKEMGSNVVHLPNASFLDMDPSTEDFELIEVRNSEEDGDSGSVIDDTSLPDSSRDAGVASSFFGMTKEVNKLICENSELLEMKNALNVLTNDLLEKLGEVSGKLRIRDDEIQSLEALLVDKNRRINSLEVEVRESKICIDMAGQTDEKLTFSDDGERLYCTRKELSRVIAEKNLFKQKLLDLEDAVRWQEFVRANRLHPVTPGRKRSAIYNLFATLFGSSLVTTLSQESLPSNQAPSNTSLPQRRRLRNCSGKQPLKDDIAKPTEEGSRRDWVSSRVDTNHTFPVYIGEQVLSNDPVEEIRGYATSNVSEQNALIWIAGSAHKSPQSSKLLAIRASESIVERMGCKPAGTVQDLKDAPPAFVVLQNREIPFVVSCLCTIPCSCGGNSNVEAQCEFCKRDVQMGTKAGADDADATGCVFDGPVICLGTVDGRVVVLDERLNVCDMKILCTYKLNCSIVTMKYNECRLACGMSNGSISVFHPTNKGVWFTTHHTISLSSYDDSIRTICFLPDKRFWASMRNHVASIDHSLTVEVTRAVKLGDTCADEV